MLDSENTEEIINVNKDNMIENGHYVIIQRIHDKNSCRLIKAEKNKCVYLGKQRFNLNGIIGHEFGSVFELDKKNNLVKLNDKEISTHLSIDIDKSDEEIKDNRFINDDGKSQKLSKEEIESFKSELSTTEIIENLVKNSTTFKEKTSFAQEKYLQKKRKKYSSLVTILKPNTRILVKMYYAQGPQKINYLRIDTLAQMLCFCNIMSGCNYIVVDSHLGILTAAVLERTGSSGSIIQVFTEPGPVTSYRQAVDALNLSKDSLENRLFGIQINHINVLNEELKNNKFSEEELIIKKEITDEKLVKKEQRRIETLKAKTILKNKTMDGLLIMTKQYEPLNILQLLFEFISYSRPFVVFSPYLEPLIPCYNALKKKSVYLRITETWMRKFQVLPDRTRPEMTMSSNGGYLLSGIKVHSS